MPQPLLQLRLLIEDKVLQNLIKEGLNLGFALKFGGMFSVAALVVPSNGTKFNVRIIDITGIQQVTRAYVKNTNHLEYSLLHGCNQAGF